MMFATLALTKEQIILRELSGGGSEEYKGWTIETNVDENGAPVVEMTHPRMGDIFVFKTVDRAKAAVDRYDLLGEGDEEEPYEGGGGMPL